MKNYLSCLDPKLLKLVHQVSLCADERGVIVYLVGGIVRDLILGKKNLDLDFIVEGSCSDLAKVLASRLKAEVQFYPDFQTATLVLKNGQRIDLAMARKEVYPYSGALPKVEKGNLKDDLFRRDFSINAMAISLNRQDFGQLIDLYGGLKDLQQGKIRVLHEKSFRDDPTRILRAVRFEQRLGFSMEPKTLKLLRYALQNRFDKNVKPPRYFNEFKKILKEAAPLAALKRLKQLKAFGFLNKNLIVDFKSLQQFHHRVTIGWKRYAEILEEPWLLYFIVLTEKIQTPILLQVIDNFQLSNRQKEVILDARKLLAKAGELSKGKLKAHEVYRMLNVFENESIVYLHFRLKRAVVSARIDRYLKKDMFVQLKITGNDLKRLGVFGQKIGLLLREVLDYTIDHGPLTKKQELAVVKRRLL